MLNFLKKIGFLQKLNHLCSDLFENNIKINDFRSALPKEAVILQKPFVFEIDLLNCQITSNPYWKDITKQKSETLYYAEIADASIVAKGIVLNKNKEVLLESTIFQKEYLNKLKSNHLVYFKNILPNKKANKVLSLANRLDGNYFHWVMESLSRVLVVYETDVFNDYSIVITTNTPMFIKESLAFLFSIPNNKIIEKQMISYLTTAKTMIVPFQHIRNEKTQMTNVYYPQIIKGLNKLAHKRLAEKQTNSNKIYPKNIIISRKNAIERRIINEKHFINKLREHEFVVLHLERLSFEEQVLHFYHAEKVLAVHGAGITNVIFGNKISLIELFPIERTIRDAFYFVQITAALQFKHCVIEYNSYNQQQDLFVDDAIYNKILNAL